MLKQILKNINEGKPYITCKRIKSVDKHLHNEKTFAQKGKCIYSSNFDPPLSKF